MRPQGKGKLTNIVILSLGELKNKMKTIKLININYHFFKGLKDTTINPNGNSIAVFGANATGKTTLFDGFLWLLFGKNSDEQAHFNVKPLDEHGQELEGLEPSVEATLLINDKQIVLKRELKEVWTKPNGQLDKIRKPDSTKLYVDGVPMKVKEYQDYINNLIEESTFKLLTNPFAFNNLHWTDKREILIDLVGDVDQQQIINSDKKLKELTTILGSHTIDEQKKIVTERRRQIKKDIDGIPARIDEATRAIPEVTSKPTIVLAKITVAEGLLDEANTQLAQAKNGDELIELKKKKSEIETKMSNEKSKAMNERYLATESLRNDMQKQAGTVTSARNERDEINYSVSQLERELSQNMTFIKQLATQKKEEEQVTFGDDASVCPTCGQDLPANKVATLRTKFNLEHSKKLEGITTNGKQLKEVIQGQKIKIDELRIDLDAAENRLIKKTDTLNQIKKELEIKSAENNDIERSKTFKQLAKQLATIEEKMNNVQESAQESISEVQTNVNERKETLNELNKQIAIFEQIEQQNVRINELKKQESEMKKVFMDLEKQLHLIDVFTRAKVKLLESKINKLFKVVQFKLFDIQKDGNLNEVCEATVNGIPFGTDLNNAARINGGLDIINTLSQKYEVTAPIFIDNAESVNTVENTDAQQIKLIVSTDKKLKVE